MEVFAPIQHTQIEWFTQWCKDRHAAAEEPLTPESLAFEQREPDPSSQTAFRVLALLNLPAFLHFTTIHSRAIIQAKKNYATWSKTSLLGRLTSPLLEAWNWKDSIIANRTHVLSATATSLWTKRFGLSSTSPLHTWLTSGFTHRDFLHLAGNMAALFLYAPVCARVPGMSASHVAAITIGSSIFASAAQLVDWHYNYPRLFLSGSRIAMGASGIVAAFVALAAVAAPPATRVRIPFTEFRTQIRGWAVTQFTVDLLGCLAVHAERLSKRGLRREPKVCFAAHLGGAVFGVLYYYVVLKELEGKGAEGKESDGGEEPEVSQEKEEDPPTSVDDSPVIVETP
ncbi:hypothetical protein PRZ48_000519 [Zasmidium cellare]|uniref:Peptidase S54 rhomboid domain-containing protein n=1 Tax=Zasmidium cellare TaxID=395010 RepID=A0ABR0F053_ZASCE|nr:hypothetical protein PRZ48_000519 [Zasmidium cellare]